MGKREMTGTSGGRQRGDGEKGWLHLQLGCDARPFQRRSEDQGRQVERRLQSGEEL